MSSQVPPPGDPQGSEPPGGSRSGDESAWPSTPSPSEPTYQAGGWGEDRPAGPRPASVGKRVGAYIIDVIGISVIALVILIPIGVGSALAGAGFAGGGFSYVGNIVWSAIVLAYFMLMEANGGQTLAKKLLGIKAVMADGRPVDMQAAFKRNLWWVVGNLIPYVGGLVGLGIVIYALVTTAQDQPLHRGFHDKFADTMVIETR